MSTLCYRRIVKSVDMEPADVEGPLYFDLYVNFGCIPDHWQLGWQVKCLQGFEQGSPHLPLASQHTHCKGPVHNYVVRESVDVFPGTSQLGWPLQFSI